MAKQTKQTREYLKQVRRALPCPAALKKQVLTGLGEDISRYIQEHPDADGQALAGVFGTPEQIAQTYIDTLSAEELAAVLRKRSKIWRAVIAIVGACALLCVLIWGCAVIAALREVQERGDLVIETQIVEG